MTYQLGIDLGTTYSAAAVHRDGRVEMVTLGTRADSVPSVLLLRADETILTGDAASRRGVTEPTRVAREFKRRVGDPTPLLVGGAPYSVESLLAKLLRWVYDQVVEREGGPPDRIALTHPANWGAYKQDLFANAVRMADLDAVTLTLTEPEAAALHYAAQERVPTGSTIAVYDLGGGTFDAAVLRKREDGGFDVLGQPEGIERLGGIDFDEAVFDHVRRAVDGAVDRLADEAGGGVSALARLREECVSAKEALSSDTDASIPVLLPNVQTEVRLTRVELEAMIRPTLADTIDAMHRALRSAGVTAEQVDKVLLVGGSSRIPLVGQLVTAELGRPVVADAHPKNSVAMGAALAASRAVSSAVVSTPVPAPVQPVVAESVVPPARPVAPAAAGIRPDRSGPSKLLVGGVAGALAVVAAAAVVVLTSQGDDGDRAPVALTGDASPSPSPSLAPTPPASRPASRPASPAASTTPIVVPSPTPAKTTGPFVEITEVSQRDATYSVAFVARDFSPSFDQGRLHVHFFWDTTPAGTAGVNGRPGPGKWLVYAGSSPALNSFFEVGRRPAGAAAICALVANAAHEIADVDEDGEPDPDSGGCAPLSS